MATIYQQIKKQRVLLVIFFIIVLITVLIWYFDKKRSSVLPPSQSFPIYQRKIEFDFQTLESQILKEFEFYQRIEPAKSEEIGRENPFLPSKK